jgi:hypothetical protein
VNPGLSRTGTFPTGTTENWYHGSARSGRSTPKT